VEETYPSGRVVRNELDGNGELAMVRSGRCLDAVAVTDGSCTNRAGLFEYAKHFSYTAPLRWMRCGLGNGLWESTQFNARLQPVQIGLGT
ncbi:hypothetical protein OFC63_30705, partial [Escherichia coli]|nr:hypothetical protein [Escherichia coli]